MNKSSPITSLKDSLLDFIFPKFCIICSEQISKESNLSFLCSDCYYNLPVAPESNVILDRLLGSFSSDDIGISNAISLFSLKDNKFLEVMHSMKYEGFYSIGYELGKELGQKIKAKGRTQYDSIIPVPIHSAKERERGYNQSKYISKGVSEILGIESNEKLIIRSKYTKSQTLLSSKERKSNIKNVYKIVGDSSLIKNRNFIIIDDVFTTGSTINHLAMELLESGARIVDCGTIGIA